MAAVGGAGGDRSEEIRKIREGAAKRESEQAKSQAQRINNLHETHETELETIQKGHERELDTLKTKSREQLSSRDMRYQKEIDGLRELHAKQLQRQKMDADTVLSQTQKSLKGENARVRETTDQQKEIIRSAYDQELKEREGRFEEYVKESRQGQQESTLEVKKKMSNVHAKETDALVKDRDKRIAELQKKTENVGQAKDEKYRLLENQKKQMEDRLLHDSRQALGRERETNLAIQKENRQDLEASVEQIKNRYEKAAETNRRDMEGARGNLEDSVMGRMNAKIRVLEDEKANLTSAQPRDRVASERQKSRELQNLRDNMQANIDNLQEVRDETLAAANEKTKTEIARVSKGNDTALNTQNRFYQDKIAQDTIRNTERLDRVEMESARLLGSEKASNTTRFEKLKGFSEMEQGKMRAYFERATTAMKENFEETLREMRERNQKEQQQLFSQFAKRSQENDAKFQGQMGELTVRYERQIADIQENHMKEMKDQQAVVEREKKEASRKSNATLSAQSSQFEYRINKIEESHAKQIADLKRKHDESLANLVKSRQS